MRDYDLATLGYEETEYAVSGTARPTSSRVRGGADGKWDVGPGAEAPFRTRIVVRRPIDPSRFSGTVVVEWHNVSAGIDAAPDWGFFHRSLTAAGHAWVGVSAQKVGIDGGGFVQSIHLKLLAPERYAELEHPGDAWSFDMFTQVAELVRLPADQNPLGGLTPEHVFAAGESQSAACLVTYINAVDPHTQVFDGYFVHGRPGIGVSIDGVFIPTRHGLGFEETTRMISSKRRAHPRGRPRPRAHPAERDGLVLLGGHLAAQPDSEHIRVWEMPGAAHADTYTVSAGRHDDGTLSPERLEELLRPTRTSSWDRRTHRERGPQQHYVAQAALAHWFGGRAAAHRRRGHLASTLRRPDSDTTSTVKAMRRAASAPRGSTPRPPCSPGSARPARTSPCSSAAPCPSTRRPWPRSTLVARTSTSSGSPRRSTRRSTPASSWPRTAKRSSASGPRRIPCAWPRPNLPLTWEPREGSARVAEKRILFSPWGG